MPARTELSLADFASSEGFVRFFSKWSDKYAGIGTKQAFGGRMVGGPVSVALTSDPITFFSGKFFD